MSFLGRIVKTAACGAVAGSVALGFLGAGAAQAQAPTTIKIMVFGGSLGNGFIAAIKGFEAENNVKFEVSESTAAQALTRLLARRGQEPEYDIVHMSPAGHFQGVQAGLWEEISPKDAPNVSDLIPSAYEDNKYVGWGTLAFGLQINTASLAKAGVPKPTKWMDLWNPAYKGKVAVEDFGNAYGQAFFDAIYQIKGRNLDATFAALKELKPNVCCFPFSPAEVDNHLLQGEAWIAPNATARANLLAAKGAPIEFVYPEDGAGAWLTYLNIPKGSPRKALALKLLNYSISPDVQAKMAVSAQVGPVNKKVVLSPKDAQGLAYGDIALKLRPILWGYMQFNLNDLQNRWMAEFQN